MVKYKDSRHIYVKTKRLKTTCKLYNPSVKKAKLLTPLPLSKTKIKLKGTNKSHSDSYGSI